MNNKVLYTARFYYREIGTPKEKFLWALRFIENYTEKEAIEYALRRSEHKAIIQFYPGFKFSGFDIFEVNSAGSFIKSRHR